MAKSWKDLTGRQRGLLGAAALVQLVLLAAALLDLRRRPTDRIRGPKGLWVAAAFVNFIGPLSYFAFGRRQ
ncbi:MAG: PLDc N-terminal domain-containing protein [Dehalococcoidia bacterium]